MDPLIVISGLVLAVVLILILGAPIKPMKWVGFIGVKVLIGVLLLFFANVFGAGIGLHIPINLFTTVVTGLLGVPGLLSLTALHIWIL
ncbi:pro-sigmaK processing inhibitor BofA family protein [Thalassobacillus pellis]|uniref:pro-sigmaK processing inhibitor BofA family protein n=1 Tax=Thalassobacillus pellis TaxID=748008 RepID=UPI0019601FE7|nr:pro-sigmaK processing inhibitor BofA family protein [Thalassobacillus pellis]MBM7552269.1 inhibitor of the pro-sigma K processing machinery [Thalassobacillus pellis]